MRALRELVVCSLEAWDDVWRRNQFLVDALLHRHAELRVLFVEPATDVLFDLSQGRRPSLSGLRSVRPGGRLHALRPLKPLPRRLGPISDALLRRQVLGAVRRTGFARPLLWVNDVTYAPLIAATGWPAVYDVTDDWLLAPFPPREVARLTRLEDVALARADEVVVCSPALAESRGRKRPVTLVPNGVDVEHFRRSRPRPRDLPPRPVALYAGSLHESRLDLDLIVDLARGAPEASIVLVGPNALTSSGRRRLTAEPNVHLLGLRPYADVPAYLQHADVLIVPHLVTPFTESLDPIKAYECLAVDTPTVATPVAGFRELAGVFCVVPAHGFTAAVRAAAARPAVQRSTVRLFGWGERAEAFEAVLIRAMDLTYGSASTSQ